MDFYVSADNLTKKGETKDMKAVITIQKWWRQIRFVKYINRYRQRNENSDNENSDNEISDTTSSLSYITDNETDSKEIITYKFVRDILCNKSMPTNSLDYDNEMDDTEVETDYEIPWIILFSFIVIILLKSFSNVSEY